MILVIVLLEIFFYSCEKKSCELIPQPGYYIVGSDENCYYLPNASGNANGTFTDSRDNMVYNWVQIGSQVWMAENLKYLPSVSAPDTGSETTPYYYVYDYVGTDETEAKTTRNYATYGVLYNWPAAMSGSESSSANPSRVQGVCPTGWHLSSDAEWAELIDYLGGESIAGEKLKEVGIIHWIGPNMDATNETGFTALPGGYRYYYSGGFSDLGFNGGWWVATEYDTSTAWYRSMYFEFSNVYSYFLNKEYGLSVRCVRD